MKRLAPIIFAALLTQTAFATQPETTAGEHDHDANSEHATPGDSSTATQTMAGMEAMSTDPWLNYLHINQFEWRDANRGSVMAWDVSAWSGNSIDKLWFNAEGEHQHGHTDHAETQLLYSRAVSSYWDVQAGVRSDIDPLPDQHWATFGVRGLAPYFFDIDAQFFLTDHGRTAARLSAEYEFLLTQKLVLMPEFKINAYGKDDIERGIGSGFSSLEAGLRLRYEIVREFTPYIGVMHERKLGDTADLARDVDEERSDTMWVIGVSAWL